MDSSTPTLTGNLNEHPILGLFYYNIQPINRQYDIQLSKKFASTKKYITVSPKLQYTIFVYFASHPYYY
jgi:hypothetical protein